MSGFWKHSYFPVICVGYLFIDVRWRPVYPDVHWREAWLDGVSLCRCWRLSMHAHVTPPASACSPHFARLTAYVRRSLLTLALRRPTAIRFLTDIRRLQSIMSAAARIVVPAYESDRIMPPTPRTGWKFRRGFSFHFTGAAQQTGERSGALSGHHRGKWNRLQRGAENQPALRHSHSVTSEWLNMVIDLY